MKASHRRDRLAAENLLAAATGAAGERDWDELQLSRRLRRLGNPGPARDALELHELRRAAASKLDHADLIFLHRKGLEQSTASAVATWRAGRVNALTAPRMPLVDLTCGLGSDAWAMARTGRRVLALDRDPETALLAGLNLERTPGSSLAVRADAARPPVRGPHLVLIDPDRRAAGRRELDPDRWSPPWATVGERLAGAVGGCAKLAPAADVQVLDAELPADLPRRWSWVGLGRHLVEVTLWTGRLAPPDLPPFEALVLERDGSLRGEVLGGAPDRAPVAPLAAADAERPAWILEPHAAVVRSGLIGALATDLDAAPLGPHLAFLGCASRPDHPLIRRWRVVDGAPADRRRVRALLREHDVGPLQLHVRGHPEPPERLAKAWRGPGARTGTLLVARLAEGHRAYLVEEA